MSEFNVARLKPVHGHRSPLLGSLMNSGLAEVIGEIPVMELMEEPTNLASGCEGCFLMSWNMGDR